jgi:hypothetical protein
MTNKINTESIIIVLDNNLHVYTVKNDSQVIELIVQLESDKYLNLADNFEKICIEYIMSRNPSEIYCIFGNSAGFTDSRIVYMWLKSWSLFTKNNFYLHNSSIDIDISRFSFSEIVEYLEPIKQNNIQLLNYSRKPRIG